MVALISIARYLAARNPDFKLYLASSLDHAGASSLSDADLAALRLVIRSVR